MAKKYLDYDGMLYFWQKIRNTFVSDITWDSTNKKLVRKKKTGTSGAEEANDIVAFSTVALSGSYYDLINKPTTATTLTTGLMSSTDKTKLNGIAEGAEANVNADWNAVSGDAQILNKPTLGAASAKGVVTTISSDSADLPTATAVKQYVSTAVSGGAAFQGTASTTFAPTNYTAGWYWVVGTAGTYVGEVCEPGDMIFATANGTTYSASDFDVIQTNLDITSITNAEIDTIVAA